MLNEHSELETRVNKFKDYEKTFKFLTSYWYITLVVGPVENFVVRQFLGREPYNWEAFVSIAILNAVWIYLAYKFGKRMNKYRLEDNEWATFYTYSILNNLEKYSRTKNIGMKKDYRKKAIENAKDFFSCIKKRWKIGNFKLAKALFEKPLSELKKNIEYRIIPSLEKGDDKSLSIVEQIMRNFHAESRSLDLQSINSANEEMSSRLGSTERMKIGLRNRLIGFISSHKILKHTLFVSSLGVGCCLFYYFTVSHLGIQLEYAFTGSIAIFLGLLTIYFSKQPKE